MCKKVLLIGAIAFCGAATCFVGNFAMYQTPTGAESYATESISFDLETPEEVVALGRLEPISGIVNISAIPGEQIDEILVAAGDVVGKGQILTKLKSYEARKLEYELAKLKETDVRNQIDLQTQTAEARLTAARLSLENAQLGAERLRVGRESLQLLEEQVVQANRDLNRARGLAADPNTRDVVSEQQIEQQSLLVKKLENDLSKAHNEWNLGHKSQMMSVRAAEAELHLAKLSSDALDKNDPLASVAKQVELSEIQFSMSTIRSPMAGTILKVFLHGGEHVTGAFPLLQIGDTSKMICVAEAYESNLRHLITGQAVTMTSRALPSALTGTVVRVGNLIGTSALSNPNPLARADRRTADVHIELDDESSRVASQYINLQVNVTITIANDAEVL